MIATKVIEPNALMTAENIEIAKQHVITAFHNFLIHSPRLCELQDKEKSGAFMDDDETQEFACLRMGSTALNLLLNP